jgi:hypothetical protein
VRCQNKKCPEVVEDFVVAGDLEVVVLAEVLEVVDLEVVAEVLEGDIEVVEDLLGELVPQE